MFASFFWDYLLVRGRNILSGYFTTCHLYNQQKNWNTDSEYFFIEAIKVF
jgi:hypothetical protein